MAAAPAVSFFAQQERARSASRTLTVLYVLSVAAIVASIDGLAALFCLAVSYKASPGLYLAVSAATLAVVAAGTLEILARLSLGEGEFAALLAGRPINRGTVREDERRLVNIVDELSLASGLHSPPLCVLNRERGINAFTAGTSHSEAVVFVTQGAIEQLSRDELQAVIAHEFGHILNGDIRINLRAVYVLQGIVFLSAIGRFMMQYYSGKGTEDDHRFFSLPFAAVGVGLFVVCSVGLLFCRIIQAAIARERENLADACAVQYTRNADALCGALARIRVNADGSRIRDWHADALSHMLFAPGAHGWLSGLFQTHPPIEERMRRINPHVSPEFYFEQARRPRSIEEKKQAPGQARPKTIVPARMTGVTALIATIGAPDAGHLEQAADMLAYLPRSIREALGDPAGAQAVMFGCVMNEELTNRERQLGALRIQVGEALARRAEVIAPELRLLDRAYRLPLVALATPVLKQLDAPERAVFLAGFRALIQADARVTLSEFVLATILDWTVGPKSHPDGVRFGELAQLAPEISLLLSLLACAGASEAAQVQAAFDKGKAALDLPALAPVAKEALQLTQVSLALERLSGLAPAQKGRVLEALAATAEADNDVKLMEHELLRAVACALHCPMPLSEAALDPRLLRK